MLEMTGVNSGNVISLEVFNRELSNLVGLVRSSEERLRYSESLIVNQISQTTSASINAVNASRRIIRALQKRLNKIDALLAQKDQTSLEEAKHLIRKDLVVASDPIHALVSEQPIPPIKSTEWRPVLEQLFSVVEKAIQQRA